MPIRAYEYYVGGTKMDKQKKGIFAVLKESLVKTGCCGPSTCTPVTKQASEKNTVAAQTVKKGK